MKKVFLFLAMAVTATISYAQETITEGIAISKQTMSSTNSQVNAQLESMGDITATTYFKGYKSRTETSNPMSGSVINIIDGESKEMLMLMNNPMMGKVYSKASLEPTEEELKNITVKEGSETKEVLGYTCKQYFVTATMKGQEVNMEFFTTDKLKAYTQEIAKLTDKIDGFPLYTVITMNQMGAEIVVTSEITEIKKESVSDEKFDMTIPEGYTEAQQP